jgi:hypothetical protein
MGFNRATVACMFYTEIGKAKMIPKEKSFTISLYADW